MKGIRPTSALPVTNFGNKRYKNQFKRNLKIIDSEHSLNQTNNTNIETKAWLTTKHKREKTMSTNLTSIDATKVIQVFKHNEMGIPFPLNSTSNKEARLII